MLLSESAKRRYNQLYALGTNEVFAVFESQFINYILQKRILSGKESPEMAKALQNFCEEEAKHAEMFHRLNAAACPEYYANEKFFLTQSTDKFGMLILKLVRRFPDYFGVWLWIALFFEERSLAFGKKYLTPENQNLSHHFKEIHRLHMIEEVHHVRLDELFVDHFYRPLSLWKRKLTALMLKRIVQSYISPKRLSKVLARLLVVEFPEEKDVIQACLNELPTLRKNKVFLEETLGLKATERTRIQLQKFPEFQEILHILPS